jgi:cobalt-zinc-cadmium efflux system membrane fusion protein
MECQYEVGVVKIDPALLKDSPGSDTGLVGVTTAMMESKIIAINVTAEIRLNENAAAHISPKIDGVIRSVNVDIGTRVKRGDILLAIESTELAQEVSEFTKRQTMVNLHSKIYSREKSLYEQKITSHQEMLEARAQLEQAKADLQGAEERLKVLGFTEKEINKVLTEGLSTEQSVLRIYSPIDGTIIEKHAVVGEFVEPTSDIIFLADLATVWVWADIYERDLAHLLEEMETGPVPVEVRQDAFPNRTFAGHVDYVGAIMDEKTRTVKVRATIDNERYLLRPGMFCEANIMISAEEKVLTVPKSALLSDEGVEFIYKHLKDDYFVRRPVSKGHELDNSVEILEGVAPGELVVSDAAFLLKSDTLRSKMGAGCAD